MLAKFGGNFSNIEKPIIENTIEVLFTACFSIADWRSQYEKMFETSVELLGTPYDFESVMHYSGRLFFGTEVMFRRDTGMVWSLW